MSNNILIKNIEYLITCNGYDDLLKNVNIYIQEGVIKDIGDKLYEDDEVFYG